MSLYTYTDAIHRYANYLGHSPDMIIENAKADENIPDLIRIHNHVGFLEDYVATLQDQGLSPGRVHGLVKVVRSFYQRNGVEIKLQEPLSRRVVFKDRAPTPEELLRLVETADLREKVILSILSLAGLREGTLAALEYRHVREDLEAGKTPLHIRIPAELTKASTTTMTRSWDPRASNTSVST